MSDSSCKTCVYWERFFNRRTDDWEYRCSYVIDHYQVRPDSMGVDVYRNSSIDDGKCEDWEAK